MTLRIVFILLFVVLGISQNVCADSVKCSIPDVENGEIGQFQTHHINSGDEEFKKFTLGQRVNQNETVYLRCQNGFFPAENSVIYSNNRFEIRCNNGTWSKDLQCKPAPCFGEPPKIDNGYPVIHNRDHGYIVQYKCNNNDITVKSNVTCHFGSWIGNAPKCLEEARCEEPQAPEHGSVRFLGDPKVGSLATYSCDPGKKLYVTATIKCQITGQWTFDPPKCVGFCSVPDVKSGEMGQIENRTPEFKKFSTGSQIDHNEMLLLRCDEGFIPTDGSTIFENNLMEVTCNDGTWSKNFWCKETSCLEDPPAIRNGEPQISSRKHGDSIWYLCDSKYTRVRGHIECRFGTWTGYTPKCLDTPCITKQLNFPGLLKPPEEELSSDESFDIVCENGFIKSPSDEKITCIRGKWDVKENPCIDHRCDTNELNYPGLEKPWPEVFESYNSFNINCKKGFKKTTLDRVITCIEGKWNVLENPCAEDRCDTNELNYPGLDKPWPEVYESYKSFTINCKKGFKKTTLDRVITCIEGKWNVPEDPCTEDDVSCSRFPHSPGLVVSYSQGVSVGSNASFSCSPPNTLIGSSYAICQNNGSWNHPLPKCEETTCPMFSTGNGLSVRYANSNRRGSWATFSCPVNTKLIGAMRSRCRNDGTWNRPEPYCETANCSIADLATSVPEDVVPDMTGVTGEFVPFGSEMRLECENNLIPNGNSKAVCRNNGEWEFGSFQCVPGCTLEIEPSSHLIIQPMKDGYRLGEFILLSCPPGEAMTTDVDRLMCLGKAWSDIIPDCKEQE